MIIPLKLYFLAAYHHVPKVTAFKGTKCYFIPLYSLRKCFLLKIFSFHIKKI